jgi:hypothetical protein
MTAEAQNLTFVHGSTVTMSITYQHLTGKGLIDDNEELTHKSRCAAAFICLHEVNTSGIVFTLIVVAVIHFGFTSVPCEACRKVTARGKRQEVVPLLNLTCMSTLTQRIFLQYFCIIVLKLF